MNVRNTGNSWWLELRSLEVLDRSKWVSGPEFFSYISKQIYSWFLELLISRNPWSLEVKLQSRCSYSIEIHPWYLEVAMCIQSYIISNFTWTFNDPRQKTRVSWNGMFIQVTLILQGDNWFIINPMVPICYQNNYHRLYYDNSET